MLWPGVTLNISLLLLLATCDPPGIQAEGSVGCLFSDRLCSEDEWCYDDLAFGRCLQPIGDVEEDDLFRFNLEREGLHELSSELRRLFALGYRWSHGYTQCRLQAMLFAYKNGLTFEPDSCSHLSDNDLEGALKALEGQVELDPREVAIIKYTPSVDDPHAAYADEVFYPPVRNGPQEDLREKILAPNAIDLEIPDPYADYSVIKREWIPQMKRRSAPRRPPGFARQSRRDAVEFLQQLENEIPEIPQIPVGGRLYDEELTPVIRFLNDMHLSPKEIRQLLVPDNRDKLRELLDGFDYGGRSSPEERFTLAYNTPDGFRAGWESRDALGKDIPEDFPESRVYYDEDNDEENSEYGSGNSFNDGQGQEEAYQQIYQQLSENEDNIRPAVYSEGGVVWSSPEKFKSEDITKNSMNTLDQILTKFNLGFKRPERLDVKKPGPPFDPQINEIARKAEEDIQKQNNIYRSISKKVPSKIEDDEVNRIRILFEDDLKYRSQGNHIKDMIQDILNLKSSSIEDFNVEPWSVTFKLNPKSLKEKDVNKLVKLMNTKDFKDGLETLTGVRIKAIEYSHTEDQAHVYVELKTQLKSWKQGEKIIKKILDRLYLEPSTFSHPKVNPYWISFKVNANSKGLNATEVAKQIETIQDQLEDINIKSVGTGNRDTIQKVIFVPNENQLLLPSMMKKGPPVARPHQSEQEKSPEYVYVSFKSGLAAWKQGGNIMRKISDLLHLEPTAFSDGKAFPYSVFFKVRPNSRGLNATEVARRIEQIKGKLGNVEVETVGFGDKEDVQKLLMVPTANQTQFFMVIFMVCGILAACIIASILLIIIRRHLKARQKLQNLSKSDTEPSKDYQDLCRSRMAAKAVESSTVHGRITSLSRESEQSPSSRSSTSSWSEEPALHNMDISTGHMVLSYMEDHLKNKDRLEQEWVALCAYVAEPCETTIANKKGNKEKNRYPDIVPYDHSRVVLNELSNANGSDYINASSITDHDPRNPAYIATQGPLPHTAPDFWQLIWEQGAVVIVMLTRLTEGGAAMCHRYWPEEGSELYHIYEVHLVSEHIWCDDYLVRSFYLKNVRTGETRTVTQFHFLSWPEAGVPSSTKALLEFRRKVNKSYRGRSCPIVVHCSDGAGRTGTYCLIDMVLSRMAKGAKEIDIAATLEHLRDQRVKMVAAKQQFEFVLTAVAEEVHAILKALPAQNPPEK